MTKLIAPLGLLVGAAVWFLLYVILGVGLGTSFIAGGSALAACVLTAGIALIDAPLTSAGLLLGIATVTILEVVLSVPLWIDVISGLGVMGLYDTADAAIRPGRLSTHTTKSAEPESHHAHRFGPIAASWRNGNDREPVGAR